MNMRRTVSERMTVKDLIEKLNEYDQDDFVDVDFFGDFLFITKSPGKNSFKQKALRGDKFCPYDNIESFIYSNIDLKIDPVFDFKKIRTNYDKSDNGLV